MRHTNSPRNILRSIFEERGGVKSHLLDKYVLLKDIAEAQEQEKCILDARPRYSIVQYYIQSKTKIST